MNATIKILFFLLSLYGSASAQNDTLWEVGDTLPFVDEEAAADYTSMEYTPYVPAPLEQVVRRPVSKAQWDEASGGLDYSKDVPEAVVENPAPPGSNFDGLGWTAATQWLGNILQVLAVLLAVAAIAYGIYRMLIAPRNRRVAGDGVEITADNLDEYLHETDLDRFLREALAQGNYPLAIRLYYLQVIKDLSEKNAIRWSREKTNRDYMREMRAHALGEQFREATRTYERIWYGNQSLSAADFARLEPQFKNLLMQIGH